MSDIRTMPLTKVVGKSSISLSYICTSNKNLFVLLNNNNRAFLKVLIPTILTLIHGLSYFSPSTFCLLKSHYYTHTHTHAHTSPTYLLLISYQYNTLTHVCTTHTYTKFISLYKEGKLLTEKEIVKTIHIFIDMESQSVL